MTDYNYSFVVEGLTAEQAQALFNAIVTFAEALGAETGGWFYPVGALEQTQRRLLQEEPYGETE